MRSSYQVLNHHKSTFLLHVHPTNRQIFFAKKKRLLSRCRRRCRRGRHAPHDLVAVPRGAAQAMLATSQRADAWKAGLTGLGWYRLDQ